jgi:hypothetical protein
VKDTVIGFEKLNFSAESRDGLVVETFVPPAVHP